MVKSTDVVKPDKATVVNDETFSGDSDKEKSMSRFKDADDDKAYINKLSRDLSQKVAFIISNYRPVQEFDPLPSDVFIVSWMKSGTTLMQNMVYQLMVATNRVPTDPTGLDYRDISAVVPFIEMAEQSGVHFPVHPYHPNAWKSHSNISCFDAKRYRDNRIIYMVRDGKEVARSFLDFTMGWLLKDGCVDALKEPFYHRYFLEIFLNCERDNGKGNSEWRLPDEPAWWFAHVKGFIDCDFSNLLFVLYEDLVANLDESVRLIADFLEISVNNAIVQRVVSACDRKKMADDTRFNDVMVSEMAGLDVTGGRRVRHPNEAGFSRYALSDECIKLYNEMFQRVFQMEDYYALSNFLRERNVRMRRLQQSVVMPEHFKS